MCYVYIYIYIERERDVYIHTHTHTHTRTYCLLPYHDCHKQQLAVNKCRLQA